MGTADLIEQTPEGLLITGLRGEKIIAHLSFYIAFVVEDEYRVTHAGHHIGNVGFVPEIEEEGYLILAGRRWKILDIDHDRKSILVEPSTGGRVPRFFSAAHIDIHPRVREVMKELLEQGDAPVYLDPIARDMFTLARLTARDSDVLRNPFFQDGLDTVWFNWTGSKIQRTLWAMAKLSGLANVNDEQVALVFEKTPLCAYRRSTTAAVVQLPRRRLSGPTVPLPHRREIRPLSLRRPHRRALRATRHWISPRPGKNPRRHPAPRPLARRVLSLMSLNRAGPQRPPSATRTTVPNFR